jgi:hypothetical protein
LSDIVFKNIEKFVTKSVQIFENYNKNDHFWEWCRVLPAVQRAARRCVCASQLARRSFRLGRLTFSFLFALVLRLATSWPQVCAPLANSLAK